MKNFFKLTTWKIIIFIIFILSTIPIPKVTKICGMTPSGISCGETSVNGIGYPIFFGEKFIGNAGVFGALYPVNLVINIVVFYLASCLVVSLYNKIKK